MQGTEEINIKTLVSAPNLVGAQSVNVCVAAGSGYSVGSTLQSGQGSDVGVRKTLTQTWDLNWTVKPDSEGEQKENGSAVARETARGMLRRPGCYLPPLVPCSTYSWLSMNSSVKKNLKSEHTKWPQSSCHRHGPPLLKFAKAWSHQVNIHLSKNTFQCMNNPLTKSSQKNKHRAAQSTVAWLPF